MMSVMTLLLTHIPHIIRMKWQIRSITNIVERLLYKENTIAVRKLGLETLLKFLDALDKPEQTYTGTLLPGALDLTPFLQNASIALPYKILSGW